jgi:chromate transporter
MDLVRVGWTFLWLSFLCIGGGLGIVPEIERQAVSAHQWVTSREFVDAYTIAQLTPGPNMKIAAFLGFAAQGAAGSLVAMLAMFVPAGMLTAFVSRHWTTLRGRPWALTAERTGSAIGMGLMAGGVYTLARSAIHDWRTGAIAVGAALAMLSARMPPVAVVLAAGLAGWLLG